MTGYRISFPWESLSTFPSSDGDLRASAWAYSGPTVYTYKEFIKHSKLKRDFEDHMYRYHMCMSLMQISAQTNPYSQVYPEMPPFFTQVLFLKADKKKTNTVHENPKIGRLFSHLLFYIS